LGAVEYVYNPKGDLTAGSIGVAMLEGTKVRQVRRSIGVGRDCRIGLVYMMRDVISRLDKLKGTRLFLEIEGTKLGEGDHSRIEGEW
jgi:hypothetical protein